MEKRKKGFTLIELVVVIAIIGALAAILVPVMMGYVRKSRVAAANDNAKQNYNTALEVVTACSAEFNGYVVDSRKSVTAMTFNPSWAAVQIRCSKAITRK